VVAACAGLVASLLPACPGLRVLATSRETLGIDGEVPYRVPSLSLPASDASPDPAAIERCEAVRLFVDRAVTVQPTFRLTPETAPVVAQICRRLDGIPLAIELAAARVKVLDASQIADRLDDRFWLLSAGSRTAIPRHQTLRALIDWSYDLLADREKMLLSRVSVFAGGWTLAAAEAVASDDRLPESAVLNVLAQLVEKSLVLYSAANRMGRYPLLETVREYARERLGKSDQEHAVRRRHCRWVQSLCEQAEPELEGGPRQEAWVDRLEEEHDNLRAALLWALENDPEAALRMASSAVWWFWFCRSHFSEGYGWLAEALDRAHCLEAFARQALVEKRPAQAARLLGAANALTRRVQMAGRPIEQALFDGTREKVRATLGEHGFAAAWEEGQALPFAEVVASVVGESMATTL
jgi:non-specific serine/threonine protein kinase